MVSMKKVFGKTSYINYRYNSEAAFEEFKLAILILLILFAGLMTVSVLLVTSSDSLEISKLHDLID